MANDIEVIKLIIVLLIIQIWKKCALYYFKLSFQFRPVQNWNNVGQS